MKTASLFTNGGSQAVRLPKDCRFEGSHVNVSRIGNTVLLSPVDDLWAPMLAGLELFTDDFLAQERVGLPLSQRDEY